MSADKKTKEKALSMFIRAIPWLAVAHFAHRLSRRQGIA